MKIREISRFLVLFLLGAGSLSGRLHAASDQQEVIGSNSGSSSQAVREDLTTTVSPLPSRDVADVKSVPRRRALIYPLLLREAERTGLPVEVADAVAFIESGYDPKAIGTVGEIGLMQVRPETAAMLGFAGNNDDLAVPEANIRVGVAYLAKAWLLARGDLCRALMKYRAGHGEERMTALSVLYCARAKEYLASIGSPLGKMSPDEKATLPRAPAIFASVRLRSTSDPKLPPLPHPRIRTAAVSRAFWAVQQTRVKILTARVHAKWQRIATR